MFTFLHEPAVLFNLKERYADDLRESSETILI